MTRTQLAWACALALATALAATAAWVAFWALQLALAATAAVLEIGANHP